MAGHQEWFLAAGVVCLIVAGVWLHPIVGFAITGVAFILAAALSGDWRRK